MAERAGAAFTTTATRRTRRPCSWSDRHTACAGHLAVALVPVSFSNHEVAFAFGQRDGGKRAGVELKKITFNPVAEDDSGFRHLRDERERFTVRDPAEDQRGRRGLAGERLADSEV